MRIKDMCVDEMPREKLVYKGAGALSNSELLAILLRTGMEGKNVIDVARELLQSGDGTLSDVAQMSIGKICEINGIGKGKAVTIAAAFELGRRVACESASSRSTPISTPKKVFQIMQPIMRDLDHEECWAIFTNKANRLISKEIIFSGGMDCTVIDNRSIIRRALDKKATGVILVHNHPSGSPLPSRPDIEQTRSLNKAMKTCDIVLIDHVIISKNAYYSFADEEVIENLDGVKNLK